MPFSVRVVSAAAHFGVCLAEEVNPGTAHATGLSCGRACLGSPTSESLNNSCRTVPSAAKYSLLVSAFLVLTAQAVDAQQPAKVPTLGYLAQSSGPAGPKSPALEAFLRGLTELGYVEGKNIAIEYRYTEGKNDRLPVLAAELAGLKMDIIVTETGGAAVEAKKATQSIPIVMENSADAVAIGAVESLDSPGGNVTGLTSISSAGAAKRLQLLAELVPNLTHVGVLWRGPVNAGAEREWTQTKEAAGPLNVQLHSLVTSDPAGLPTALGEAKRQQVQAIVQFDTAFLTTVSRCHRRCAFSTYTGRASLLRRPAEARWLR